MQKTNIQKAPDGIIPAIQRLLNHLRAALPQGRPLPADMWWPRHLAIVVLLWIHVIGIACFGILTNHGIVHSLTEAGLVAALAALAASTWFSRRLRSTLASLGLITSSAVLVHLSGGYIEFHFHFFVMVAVIALYQDWVPFLLTIGFVVLHHGVMGVLDPTSVYNHPDAWAHPWKWAAIHAVFIVGISIASIVNWRLNEAARAKTELVLNSVGEGICGLDFQGKITFVNPAAATMLGWKDNQLSGRPIHDIVRSKVERPNVQTFNVQTFQESKNEVFYRKDGTSFPVEYVSTPLEQNGQIIGATIIFKDITERKQAEEALRESEASFKIMFTNNPLPMWVYDIHTLRFLEVNEAAIEHYGYSRQEFLGMSITDIRPEEDVPRLLEELAKPRPTLQHSDPWQHRRKDGRTIDVQISSHILTLAGHDAILVVVRDVTEQRKIEEERRAKEAAEAANRAKSEFLSRMSHELRTPLNSILGFAQLLRLDSTTPEQHESVDYVIKGGKHLLELINEVLDITRIETGNLTISAEPVSLFEVLEECFDLVRPMAAQRALHLKTGTSLQRNWYVMADRQRLKQVVLNLLSNAIKYNREEGNVSLACEELLDNRMRVWVSDTGHGIAPEKMSRLFTPFERLGAEQSAVEGTGLGLALSKRLVEAMGGCIGVDSKVGQGSTFWVELPLAEGQVQRFERAGTGPLSLAHMPIQERKILYIEDNLSNLRLIERILALRVDIKLVSTMQGRMGVDLAREHRPDLILLDLHLPDIPGDEVLRLLREHPDTNTIPVVVISADATPRQIEQLLAAGAQAYLTKPLDLLQFAQVLEETLAKVGVQ